jgi:outer membrane receptor protein involved in Fe transport
MSFGKKLICSASFVALTAGGAAYAQDGADDDRKLDTVTVTGSFIPGSAEDAALPVDVLTAADLRLEGNPTVTDLIKNLGVSSGTDGQTNQFGSNNLEGTSNINLRGLGPARSLVLLNGRRQTFHPRAIGEQAQLFVNTNNIPSAAIGRVEVLKDGAAALYGSDAIAGVVNFITRDDVDGFEFSADYSQFDGSDGEYRISGQYGLQGDNFNWVTTLEYQKRAEVALLEKDWAISSFADNPVGGWSSLSNPGYYVDLGNGAPVSDAAGCTAVGGTLAPFCRFQFTQFDNLVEEEEQIKFFTEYNRQIGGGELHLEFLYSHIDTPEWKTSPSYPPQSLTSQVVPANHPGFLQYQADNPGAFTGAPVLFIGRTFGWGGFPGTGGAQEGSRVSDAYSGSASYAGSFSNDVNYDFAATYSTIESDTSTNDTYVGGLSAALQGFGLCADPITGTPNAGAVAGQGGCEYYNPFSNAIQSSAITGAVNSGYVAGFENSAALADWLTDPNQTVATTSLFELDAVFSGTSSVQASGGAVGWAAGAQIRRETYEVEANDLTNLDVTPGLGGTGPFAFLAGTNETDADQTIYALFGELQIPLFENLDLQVAARFEDYGGETGSTFDPKVAGKWTINDNFALRGNAQTSFRGPTLNQLDGTLTTLQFVAPTSAFKAVDQFGNPNLNPESAFSYNLGALFNTGNFNASIDYYSFDFSDPIIVEEQSSIVSAAIAALGTATTDDDGILSRITFTDNNNDGINQANEIARISTNVINGPDIKTSGIDVRAENVWDMGENELSLALDMTYILEYDVGDLDIEGTNIAGGDRVDQFNRSNFSRSLPQLKANVTGNYAMGEHNFRGVLRYIDSYDDERGDLTGNGSETIDSQTTVDLFYNWQSQWDLDLGLSVVNVFDEDPPFAAFDLNYDPYTHNPFGRTFKISVTKRFGGAD